MSTIRQFYVTDKASADRATQSHFEQKPIEISGTVKDKVQFFVGIVKNIEEDKLRERWRVTILEEN
jgi:hypothetical protein